MNGKSNRIRTSRLSLWIGPTLYGQVKAKAQRESINLSALVRGFLRDWLNGEAEDESPGPQKGER